jgi:hypothetical protein
MNFLFLPFLTLFPMRIHIIYRYLYWHIKLLHIKHCVKSILRLLKARVYL